MKQEPLIPWNSLQEDCIVKIDDSTWAIRLGVVVNKPNRKRCFEDSCLSLVQHHGDGNSVLGYTLHMKKEFPHVVLMDAFLTLFSNNEVKNRDPKMVYKDQKVHLYKFNGNKDPNYWLLLRTRIGN